MERAPVKSNTPSSFQSTNAVSGLQLQVARALQQPPTSNSKSCIQKRRMKLVIMTFKFLHKINKKGEASTFILQEFPQESKK
jgi:hypothetical protein